MNNLDEPSRDRKPGPHAISGDGPRNDRALERIGEALSGLRFGSVLAIVQDGVVIQIERTEKTRFDRQSGATKRQS